MEPSPPLAAVALGVLRAEPRLAPLASVISEFLDVAASLSLARAAASGSARLFDRVAVSLQSADPALRGFYFARAMHAAMVRDDLTMTQRVHFHHPEPLFMDYDNATNSIARAGTIELALRYGTLETVQWAMEHRRDRMCSGPGLQNLCPGCVGAALAEIGDRDVFRVSTWLLECGVFPASDGQPLRYFRRPLELSVEFVRWAHERHLLDESHAVYLLERAVVDHNAASAVYLLEQGYRLESRRNMKNELIRAASARQETIVDALIQYGECDSFKHEFTWAPARPGGPKLLQWHQKYLHEDVFFQFTIAELIQTTAFMDINVDFLDWLRMERNVTTFKIHSWCVVPEEAAVLRLYDWMKGAGLMDLLRAYTVNYAAESGHLKALEWLHVHTPDRWTTSAMDAAASRGRLHVLEWLHTHRNEGCTVEAMNQAAARGDLDVVKWLHNHYAERCDLASALSLAVNYGHLDIVVWLTNHRDVSQAICTSCLIRAKLYSVGTSPSPYVIQWLTSHPTPPCKTCAHHAAVKNPTLSALERALNHGNFDLTKYFYGRLEAENEFKIRRQTLKSIAASGHLPILQWLAEHGEPAEVTSSHETWDGEWQEALVEALGNGQDHVVRWINNHGMPIPAYQFGSV